MYRSASHHGPEGDEWTLTGQFGRATTGRDLGPNRRYDSTATGIDRGGVQRSEIKIYSGDHRGYVRPGRGVMEIGIFLSKLTLLTDVFPFSFVHFERKLFTFAYQSKPKAAQYNLSCTS